MKAINKRSVILSLLGLILTRAMLYSMNPIAIAYFGAMYVQKTLRYVLLLSTLGGLAIWMPFEQAVKYGSIVLIISVVVGIVERRKVIVSPVMMGLLAGTVTIIVGAVENIQSWNLKDVLALIALEGILVFAIETILFKGLGYLLHCKRGQPLTNEELISVSVLLALIVYAIPNISGFEFSFMETAAYLLILVMGYKFGAGPGAIAGTGCGIVMCMRGASTEIIGIMCILGICAGIFRIIGKFGTAISYIVVTIALGYFYQKSLLGVGQVRALASAVAVFVLLPRSILFQNERFTHEREDVFVRDDLQDVARGKLKEFSESFQKLSKTFYSMSNTKSALSREDINQIFDGLSDNLCRNCVNCNHCWKHNFYDTYKAAFSILSSAEKNGQIQKEDIPPGFAKQCIHLDSFLNETNRGLELANLNLVWYNKMAQSREAIAGQLGEVAAIIQDFSEDLYDTVDLESSIEDKIIRELKTQHIDVKKVAVLERRNKKQNIYLTARTHGGRCITTREAAAYISRVFGKRMKPADGSKNIISKEYDTIVFVEETNFKTLTGIAKAVKKSEKVSGDNYSFIYLDSGEMIMTLSDGMGTGIEACEESESIIELMEQFMEAGFKEESAIKLINSILVLKSDQQSCSTIDMSIVDLFTGMCDFIKIGAAPTFIKRGEWIDTITSTSLPVGVFNQVDIDGVSKKLYDGDIIVMMTDGVLDCIQEEEKEKFIETILSQMKFTNPQEIAEEILERAIEQNDHTANDDMTVIVAGLWKK